MSIKIKRKSVKCRVVSEVLRLCQKFWGLNESQVIELRRKEIICCGGKIIRNLLYVIYVYELSFSLYTKLHWKIVIFTEINEPKFLDLKMESSKTPHKPPVPNRTKKSFSNISKQNTFQSIISTFSF